MRIDRSVDIEIGGTVRRLRFSVGAFEELEAMLKHLPGGIVDLLAKQVWTVSETVSALLCGLKWEERGLQRTTVQSWVADYCRNTENGFGELHARIVAAAGLSGLFGSTTAFEDILKSLEAAESEAGDTETEKK